MGEFSHFPAPPPAIHNTRPARGPSAVGAASAVGRAGLRCLVSYRALAGLAEDTREGQPSMAEIQAISAILDRLQELTQPPNVRSARRRSRRPATRR